MLAKIQRHETIIKLIREHGFMPIEQLAHTLDVTPQTIRRDINHLCESNILRRYHGGAALCDNPNSTQTARTPSSSALAELVASHIPEGASLFMSIGDTIEAVAQALVKTHSNLCIITNNIHVASIVSVRSDYTVIITSGVVRPIDGGVTGVATVDFINQFKVDYAILSASGVEEDGALLDLDYKEVCVMQAMMANARLRYLAVDYNNLAGNTSVRIGHMTEFNSVFGNRPASNNIKQKLLDAGVDYFLAAE